MILAADLSVLPKDLDPSARLILVALALAPLGLDASNLAEMCNLTASQARRKCAVLADVGLIRATPGRPKRYAIAVNLAAWRS